MSFVRSPDTLPPIQLTRDIVKYIKRGHRWVFATGIEDSSSKSGLRALFYKKELIGLGVLQADTQLRFRLFCLADEPYFRKNSAAKTFELWGERQWKNAVKIRQSINLEITNSFRLFNGEGDGVPGLTVDIYNDVAVIKHDHGIMESVWNSQNIAERIVKEFPQVKCVYLKRRNDAQEKGTNLIGQLPAETIFKENRILFSSNIRDAAKTGFFLDQRDNRYLIKTFAKDAAVLNLFSYTGGFSLFAAAGGAKHVTSVDIAKVAIENVKRNFEINNFSTEHRDIAADAFEFVDNEIVAKSKYDIVITDPPSFAPNEKSVPQATTAYTKIYSHSIRLVKENGLFAASSCSSHIDTEAFLEITREAFSKASRRGTLIHLGSQPVDHPYPIAMPELRYLKFALFRVES
ncbi:MAG: class I SAM-dependent rRNA methyltransferase [Bdellovibrionaceae bacterium]|nr:class I SAM-dependent rRNA methyltransferase [Pseudobdellovibrionaceae bacterium]